VGGNGSFHWKSAANIPPMARFHREMWQLSLSEVQLLSFEDSQTGKVARVKDWIAKDPEWCTVQGPKSKMEKWLEVEVCNRKVARRGTDSLVFKDERQLFRKCMTLQRVLLIFSIVWGIRCLTLLPHWKSISNVLVTFKNGPYIFGAQIYTGSSCGNIRCHHS